MSSFVQVFVSSCIHLFIHLLVVVLSFPSGLTRGTFSEISNVSLDSDLTEFMPELQSAEAQAALDVPLMSQDPPEVEQMVEDAYLQEESERSTRKRTKNTGGGERSEGAPAAQGLTLPLSTEGGKLRLGAAGAGALARGVVCVHVQHLLKY